MGITTEEQNKEKRMKRTEDSLRDLWQYQTHQHSNYRGPRREKERVWENFWRDYSWKCSQDGKGNSQSVQGAQRVPYKINPGKTHQDTY